MLTISDEDEEANVAHQCRTTTVCRPTKLSADDVHEADPRMPVVDAFVCCRSMCERNAVKEAPKHRTDH